MFRSEMSGSSEPVVLTLPVNTCYIGHNQGTTCPGRMGMRPRPPNTNHHQRKP